ncbi:MAG: hypothetical protein Q4D62_09860 [Planctomycetia bacterium]|nr:hypothetical protein [Planctomycetia bacterium]
MKSFLQTLLCILLIFLAGWGLSYLSFSHNEKVHQQLGKLQTELETTQAEKAVLEKENQKLDLANRLLKVDVRRARIEVLGQEKDGETIRNTTIRFTELDSTGAILVPPREWTIAGDLLYIDSLVVKFEDEQVETATPAQSQSICVFRRLFSEHQNPADGIPIDPENSIPVIYRSSSQEPSPYEQEIWRQFWEISNDPQRQKQLGIRAIHGEAPNQKLVPGRIYYVELRASGGLSIRTE